MRFFGRDGDESAGGCWTGCMLANGQTLGELAEGLDMTRQPWRSIWPSWRRHNLVATLKRGREKLHFLNPVPIHDLAERWIGKYERTRLAPSATSEEPGRRSESNDRFVYVTYIRTTPEKLWEALTKQSSRALLGRHDARDDLGAGCVLEADGPRRRVADSGRWGEIERPAARHQMAKRVGAGAARGRLFALHIRDRAIRRCREAHRDARDRKAEVQIHRGRVRGGR